MADFCKEHSIEMWGKDTQDLAGVSTEADTAHKKYAKVICESCGVILVDHTGTAVYFLQEPTHHSLPRHHEQFKQENV